MGVITAQFIGLISYPILSRIYTPEQFGVYALFSSSVLIGSIIVTGTYEFAIPLITVQEQVKKLLRLCLYLSIGISGFLFVLLQLFADSISSFFQVNTYIVLLIPLGVMLHSWLTIKTQLYTYSKSFKSLSISKITQTTSVSITQIITGISGLGPLGLIIGHWAGRIGFLLINIQEHLKLIWHTRVNLKVEAKKYIDHPKFVLPSSLIDALSRELPVFMILPLFGGEILGQYSLAFQVVIAPVLLVSSSIDSVFFQNFSISLYNKKKVTRKILKIWIVLSAVGIIPFTVIFIWGVTIFDFLFGFQWSYAGKIASYLSIMLFARFIFLPTAKSMLVLKKQKWMPVFSFLSLIITLISFLIGHKVGDFNQALIFLTLGQALLYLSQMVFIYYSAAKYESNGP